MRPNRTLVIATRNKGKTAEIRELLQGFPVSIKNLDDFGPIPDVEEDGATFEENAYKKASFTARVLGFPALADDSGLCVDVLGGAPGVQSARWAGEQATDQERCRKLLEAVGDSGHRRAVFHCVLSLAVPAGPALTYEASCEGEIARTPAGENGFGYDPIFYFPSAGRTFAQLSREEKGRISHRGRALNELRREFDKVLKWIDRHLPADIGIACFSGLSRPERT
jgi:XTP/dITP diphosphohydrolase